MPLIVVCEECMEPLETREYENGEDYYVCPKCGAIYKYIWFDYWEEK